MRHRCGLLKNAWYAVATSDELPAGRPLGRVVLDTKLVVWRLCDGQPAAMHDRCLHRNAPLSEGTLQSDKVVCPYHGWTYNAQGFCVAIPSQGPDARTRAKKHLETFPVREERGLIWVWMGGEVAPGPRDTPFTMPYWETPGWGAYYMVTMFDNNVTNLVENFMDVPHTVFVHRGWFRTPSRRRIAATVERTTNSVLVTYRQPNDSIGFYGRFFNPRNEPMKHTDKFYMPNVTRVDYVFGRERSGFVITSTCTPVSDFKTAVYTLVSYKLGPLNPLARHVLPPYTRQVIQQDVDIMAVQGANLQHHGTSEFNSTPVDRLHVDIEALRGWAEAGGADQAPQPRVSEIQFWA